MALTIQYFKERQLSLETTQQVSAFLKQVAGFSYFQSPYFYNACLTAKNSRPYYILVFDEGELVGILLFFIQLQISIPIVSFLSSRAIMWGGPIVKQNRGDVMDALLGFYVQQAPPSIYTQVRNIVDTEYYKVFFSKHKFQYEDHLTILVDLNRSVDELWQDVYTKRRNQIRRAEKEGCSVGLSNDIESLSACYAILQEVYTRAKLPLPNFGHFESLLQNTDDYAGLRVFTVQWDGTIIGCMLCLAYGNSLFDYYAGAYSQYYKKYPNDLLPWAVFNWAKKNGFTHFDFGGAGKPGIPYGVRDYKKRFGGSLVCYGRYERIRYPHFFGLIKKLYQGWQLLKR